VRHAAHFKIDLFEVARFDRRIVKNIEVLGAKSVRAARRPEAVRLRLSNY
jgi:hypothetical protein